MIRHSCGLGLGLVCGIASVIAVATKIGLNPKPWPARMKDLTCTWLGPARSHEAFHVEFPQAERNLKLHASQVV